MAQDLAPLVLAARLSKEGHSNVFVRQYLAFHWNMDFQGKPLKKQVLHAPLAAAGELEPHTEALP